MALDGLAAIQFLVTGQFRAFAGVLAAHIDLYKNLNKLKVKRAALLEKTLKTNHPEIYKGNIIFDFFILKKRKFSSLNFRKHEID